MTKDFPRSVCRNGLISQNIEGVFENGAFLGQVHLTKKRQQNCLPPPNVMQEHNKQCTSALFLCRSFTANECVSGLRGELEKFTSCVIADESAVTSTTASNVTQRNHTFIITPV
jgi:hypothetical protein